MQENNYQNITEAEKKPVIQKHKKFFKSYFAIFIAIVLLAGSFWLGYTNGKRSASAQSQSYPLLNSTVIDQAPQNSADKNVDFSLFWKVWDLLKQKYVDRNSLDAQKLVYGAIQGMLSATGDPYTTFFNPQDTQSFSQDIGGSFEGIGAELGVKDGVLTVIAPLDGSPAQKAGLRTGDKIAKINEQTTSNMTIDQAVNLIRGQKGTSVNLTVLHQGDQSASDINIVRDVIDVKTVSLQFKDDNIAYLKISQFGEKTSSEFDAAMNQIIAKGSKGIVLDLRDNPGGLLDQAVDVASRLIPQGKVVVTEQDSNGQKTSLYTSGGDNLSSLPIVVLINEGSASASEILAGALRDDRGVQLVGKTSFGKGSVQELLDLPGNSSVKITVAKWLTPNGDYIMKKGIIPGTQTDLTQDDIKNNRDPQFAKAAEILKSELNK